MNDASRIVIIGNGVAGITCARHLRKRSSALEITVISSETPHFFSRTALMYIYMGHMRYEHTKPYEDSFWKKSRIELCYDHVARIDPSERRIHLKRGAPMGYDKLVLATGSRSLMLDWPGTSLIGVQGMYSYPDLLKMQQHTRGINRAVVVGGGLIGIEMVEMLHAAEIETAFLVRERSFWGSVLPREESEMVTRHIHEQDGVQLRTGIELKELRGDAEGRLSSVVCSDGSEIEAQFAGITVGVQPNTGLCAEAGIETRRGVLVDEYLRTSLEDVYAIGDCAELRAPLPHRRAIEAVWYVGRMMGEALARTLTGEETPYRPGIWFNSAKFFDIEYQVYGRVATQVSEEEDSLYWAHRNGRQAMRIVWKRASGQVIGCNTLGIRQRHEQWASWIKEGASLEEVLTHLERARFDSEFEYSYEPKLRAEAADRGLLSSTEATSLTSGPRS